MSLQIPKQIPEKGFYYHYKHDPTKDINNYAYEIIGIGFHSEEDHKEGEAHFVIYLPLYEAYPYKASKELSIPCFDARPLEMFLGNVDKDGETVPRFKKITDQEIITKLKEIKSKMY